MRLVNYGTEYNIGTSNTLEFAVNPQISIEDAEATEGTDTHLEFKVTLLPAALEPTTVSYFTTDVSATAGTDYTQTSSAVLWSVGDSVKYIRVPITDDTCRRRRRRTGADSDQPVRGDAPRMEREGYFQNGQYVPTSVQQQPASWRLEPSATTSPARTRASTTCRSSRSRPQQPTSPRARTPPSS